jgi:MarR family transcriptional regulator, transcriptional regulator for hemolysin
MIRAHSANQAADPPGPAEEASIARARWGSPQAPVGQQLAFTAKVLREWFEQQLADAGGSLTTWIVLSAAINSPESPSQSELAAYMGIGGPTLVRHIDRLESEGLLTRRRDDVDRRVTRIDITTAGRQRHRELGEVSARTDAELRSLISDHDEQIVRSVLQRFTDHVAASNDSTTNERDAG